MNGILILLFLLVMVIFIILSSFVIAALFARQWPKDDNRYEHDV